MRQEISETDRVDFFDVLEISVRPGIRPESHVRSAPLHINLTAAEHLLKWKVVVLATVLQL